ncbi:hypothetical protein SAMN00790413_06158 [Deinococcus hopiensis KR-140]|uniref:Uncharacterized protein n=1 Tax=Deinococcus hopiensis KR-140 TaxID=695939 RepID=A0A1W1VWN7_9DEIO|nr:hypothetical protein SAMN00790413_06158 [Deinococcus hopiensis KR-140]
MGKVVQDIFIRPLAKVVGEAGSVARDRLRHTLKMNRKPFRRRTGVYPATFAEKEEVLALREGQKKSGRPAAPSVAG